MSFPPQWVGVISPNMGHFQRFFFNRTLKQTSCPEVTEVFCPAMASVYPKWNALRSELTWTHYRALHRVEDDSARNWYMEECVRSGWSSCQLEQQISTLYYDQLLASRDKAPVIAEAGELMKPLAAEKLY